MPIAGSGEILFTFFNNVFHGLSLKVNEATFEEQMLICIEKNSFQKSPQEYCKGFIEVGISLIPQIIEQNYDKWLNHIIVVTLGSLFYLLLYLWKVLFADFFSFIYWFLEQRNKT